MTSLKTTRLLGTAAICCVATLLGPPGLRAQEPVDHSLMVLAGPSPYDLAGTGTGTAAGAEYGWHYRGMLHGGVSLNGFTYRSQAGRRIIQLFPEFTARILLTKHELRPFVGGGYGVSVTARGPSGLTWTLHAVLGFDAMIAPGWLARAEARLRSVKPWTGETVDLRVGIGRRW
ncbi:MAG: hypothetical protein AB7I33_04625 [Gemmatimonadales bacterium]